MVRISERKPATSVLQAAHALLGGGINAALNLSFTTLTRSKCHLIL
jgi:hypothetical protein